MIEAEIDFADEDDVPGSVSDAVWSDVRATDRQRSAVTSRASHAAEIIRDGFDVVILGAPNAGKSSLFNALARREAAIVTDEPGTTRDLLEVVLDLDGLQGTDHRHGGIARARAARWRRSASSGRGQRRGGADLLLLLEDMAGPSRSKPVCLPMRRCCGSEPRLDLADGQQLAGRPNDYDSAISTRHGDGLTDLLDEIGRRAGCWRPASAATSCRRGCGMSSCLTRHVRLSWRRCEGHQDAARAAGPRSCGWRRSARPDRRRRRCRGSARRHLLAVLHRQMTHVKHCALRTCG